MNTTQTDWNASFLFNIWRGGAGGQHRSLLPLYDENKSAGSSALKSAAAVFYRYTQRRDTRHSFSSGLLNDAGLSECHLSRTTCVIVFPHADTFSRPVGGAVNTPLSAFGRSRRLETVGFLDAGRWNPSITSAVQSEFCWSADSAQNLPRLSCASFWLSISN